MTLPTTVTGPADAPAVLFLHGFMGAKHDWNSIAERLADRFRCVAVDLPSHGEAVGLSEEAYTVEGTAAAVLATLDALEIRRAHLVGYSMGGRLALWLAVHHIERVGRLILASASPGLRTEAERAERRRLDAERAAAIEADFEGFLDAWAQLPIFDLDGDAARADFVAARRRNHPPELARSLRGFGTGAQPSLWPHLDRLAAPGLAVAGGRDAKFVDLAFAMTARAPSLRPLILPAGHALPAELPALFATLVGDFFAPPLPVPIPSPSSDTEIAL